MADTPRLLSALLALWADNTNAAISPQDDRDVLVSVHARFDGVAKSGAYTLTDDDVVVEVTTGGGGVTITLPTLAAARNGKLYLIIKVDSGAGALTVDGDGAETINGGATIATTTEHNAFLIWEGASEWKAWELTGA